MAASLSNRALVAGAVFTVVAAMLLPASHVTAHSEEAKPPSSAADYMATPPSSDHDVMVMPPPTAASPDVIAAMPPSSMAPEVPPSLAPALPAKPVYPFVVVEGVVYCKSCKGKGYNKGIDASPRCDGDDGVLRASGGERDGDGDGRQRLLRDLLLRPQELQRQQVQDVHGLVADAQVQQAHLPSQPVDRAVPRQGEQDDPAGGVPRTLHPDQRPLLRPRHQRPMPLLIEKTTSGLWPVVRFDLLGLAPAIDRSHAVAG